MFLCVGSADRYHCDVIRRVPHRVLRHPASRTHLPPLLRSRKSKDIRTPLPLLLLPSLPDKTKIAKSRSVQAKSCEFDLHSPIHEHINIRPTRTHGTDVAIIIPNPPRNREHLSADEEAELVALPRVRGGRGAGDEERAEGPRRGVLQVEDVCGGHFLAREGEEGAEAGAALGDGVAAVVAVVERLVQCFVCVRGEARVVEDGAEEVALEGRDAEEVGKEVEGVVDLGDEADEVGQEGPGVGEEGEKGGLQRAAGGGVGDAVGVEVEGGGQGREGEAVDLHEGFRCDEGRERGGNDMGGSLRC